MNKSNTDRIEKTIELKASPERVWRALTDYKEFGEWFRVNLEGPFVPGKSVRGRITYPGYEHLLMEVVVVKMERAAVLVPLASVPDRSQGGLFQGAADPGGVHFGKDGDWNLVESDRVRLRRSSGGATRRGLPHE